MRLWVFWLAACCLAQAPEPLASLARRAAAAAGARPVTLQLRSGGGEARLFESELRRAGARIEPGAGAAEITLWRTEGLTGPLWSVEVRTGTERQVFVQPAASAAPAEPRAVVTLAAAAVLTRTSPILDVQGEVAVTAVGRNASRDPRGVAAMENGRLRVWTTDAVCEGPASEPLQLTCSNQPAPWPLRTGDVAVEGAPAPGRNFFTGDLAGRAAAPWFTAARAGDRWIAAFTDGRTMVIDGPALPGAGSDLAVLPQPCGGARVVLATRAAAPDTVQAFLLGESAVPGPEVRLAGPVTALWRWDDDALAVARENGAPENGERYVAYRISAHCGL